MTEPTRRPKRPPVLIAALVALPLAALLFGMTATNLGGPGGANASLPSATVLISLLAIRFNWARVAALVALAILTVEWLPGAVHHLDDERTSQAATYVLIGTVLFVAGAVLAFLTPSNQYYRQAARWRNSRKQRLS
ncbi:hypothetical protein [Amycolatopsis jiangsuensis]|uniref:Uncharacterized protein n=1 Tax=Amycolatopsis jiangsuensis TaxID=1181879 RepID=A0A840J2Q7_9PSEU|nr:hypothetical protein [Amycolatopsis jiangsuensis]MBB4688340.1 hypothetical protein [Amycolatopsis jiangsuensis]